MVKDKTKVISSNEQKPSPLDAEAIKKAKRETFRQRAKTGFLYIISWVVLYIVLDYLSSNVWTFGAINQNVRIAFNFVNLILLVPILFFGIKEICDMCFKGNKKILISFTIVTFLLYIGVGVLLLLSMGGKLNIISKSLGSSYKAFLIYIIALISSLIALFIASTAVCAIKDKKHLLADKRTLITFPGLVLLVTAYACAFFYVSMAHQWTTCFLLTILPMCADVFAYISGLLFGKHKMCPNISPKKTWEGLIGSIIITTLIICGLYGFFFIPNAEAKFNALYSFLGCQTCNKDGVNGLINLQPYFWAIYVCVTMLLIGVSTIGDLFYSWIKRKYQIKDFSNLLPGHGGILDRIDSSTFIFVFYFIITIILQLAVRNSEGVNEGIKFLWANQL